MLLFLESVARILSLAKKRGEVVDVIKQIKKWIEGQDRKKLIENAVIVAIIGVIVIIAGSTLFSGSKSGAHVPVQEQQKNEKTSEVLRRDGPSIDAKEEKLKSILSQMQGVGKVDVMITYDSSEENIPAFDTRKSQSSTVEKDNEGGTRTVTQEDFDSTLAYEDSSDGGNVPVILKKTEPEVRGVLVVAEGADNIVVRERIINAVRVALDIPLHRVEVVQRKK